MPTDPITVEVIRNAINAYADEMGTALCRSAYNMMIYEVRDYCCGLIDTQARMISQNKGGLPIFLAGLYLIAKGLRNARPICLAFMLLIVPIVFIPLFLRLPAILVIGLWAATQFVNGFGALSANVADAGGGTAYFAHIGGFAFGAITIALFRRRNTGTRGAF